MCVISISCNSIIIFTHHTYIYFMFNWILIEELATSDQGGVRSASFIIFYLLIIVHFLFIEGESSGEGNL